jgi:hypothetical protein
VPVSWEAQQRRRLRDHLSMPKVQTRRPSLSMSLWDTKFGPMHQASEYTLTAFREFLKNAEADEKKSNNADATKKDAGR